MKIYEGERSDHGETYVTVREDDGPRRRLIHRVRHSPDGFEWGYAGSGPADLARSILYDLLGETLADRLYQLFKFRFIAPIEREGFRITEAEVREWLGPVLKEFKERLKENR